MWEISSAYNFMRTKDPEQNSPRPGRAPLPSSVLGTTPQGPGSDRYIQYLIKLTITYLESMKPAGYLGLSDVVIVLKSLVLGKPQQLK